MSHHDPAGAMNAIRVIRDQFIEARRHVAGDAKAVGHYLGMARKNLTLNVLWGDIESKPVAVQAGLMARRAGDVLLSNPEVSSACLTVALYELGSLASELRRGEDAEARDEELMEAFGPKGEAATP